MTKNIPAASIEQVRLASDIVDVVSGYLTLQKKGRNYFGLCPFHQEKTPSFSVNPEMQIFHRCRRLRELGVETLICGAISNPAFAAACAEGITVIPWISGDVEEVIDSFMAGTLPSSRFMMPGCRGRGRRVRRRWIGKMGRGPIRGGRG